MLPAAILLLAAAAAAEWQPMFDGKSLAGWVETRFPEHGSVRVENDPWCWGLAVP
jgi:hypothetical protein